jgi:hypothetical protein
MGRALLLLNAWLHVYEMLNTDVLLTLVQQVTSLIEHERITTTMGKAKEVRRFADHVCCTSPALDVDLLQYWRINYSVDQ